VSTNCCTFKINLTDSKQSDKYTNFAISAVVFFSYLYTYTISSWKKASTFNFQYGFWLKIGYLVYTLKQGKN